MEVLKKVTPEGQQRAPPGPLGGKLLPSGWDEKWGPTEKALATTSGAGLLSHCQGAKLHSPSHQGLRILRSESVASGATDAKALPSLLSLPLPLSAGSGWAQSIFISGRVCLSPPQWSPSLKWVYIMSNSLLN